MYQVTRLLLYPYNQFQNYWDRTPYRGKCCTHFDPPFQCCVLFAIKFDESGCFYLKLSIDWGGERIYRQQFLHTGLWPYVSQLVSKVIVVVFYRLLL